MVTDCHRATRKPAHCPECESRRIADILYGHRGLAIHEAVARGEVVIGGCVITGDDPH